MKTKWIGAILRLTASSALVVFVVWDVTGTMSHNVHAKEFHPWLKGHESTLHCTAEVLLNKADLHSKFMDSAYPIWHSKYCKVLSSNTSRLEAHTGFFRLLMKGIFDPYVL